MVDARSSAAHRHPVSASDAPGEATSEMRRFIGDLLALSALPATWRGQGPAGIASALAEAVLRTLRTEAVYVCLTGADHAAPIELVHPAPQDDGSAGQRAAALRAWSEQGRWEEPGTIAGPAGGQLRVVALPLGQDAGHGTIVAAAARPDFPSENERLLLRAAANQATVALHDAQLIADERRSREELRRKEQQLADFVENAPVALHWVGPDGTILWANQAELDLLGYSREEYVGRHISEFHADADVIDDILSRLIAGETLHGCGARLRCKDGSTKQVQISSNVFWEDGRFVHTRCFTRDITDQKRAEQQLSVQYAVTRALAEAETLAQGGASVLRSIGEHFDWAVGALWLVDHQIGRLRCTEVWSRPAPELIAFLDDNRAHAFGPGEGLPGLAWARGEPVWLDQGLSSGAFPRAPGAARAGLRGALAFPVRLGDETLGVIEFFSRHPRQPDVDLIELSRAIGAQVGQFAERLKVEEERRELLVREQAARREVEILHQVGQVIAAELDVEKLVQVVTDAATTLCRARFGAFFYNVVDERGERFTLYTISGVPREAFTRFPMPRNTHLFGPTFRGEGVIRIDDVRQDPRFGKNPPFNGMPAGHLPVRSYLAVPVISRAGEVIGGLFFGHPDTGVFTEADERVVAGMAVQAASAMDNARMYQQSQYALRARDRFLAGVSHDLRTPLTSIKGYAQVLRRAASRVDGAAGERLAEGLSQIEVATARMTAMIGELLDVARLELGQTLELDRGRVELIGLVRRIVAVQQDTTSRHAIRVETDLAALHGRWDGARLERVLDNLLSNAVKYSPDGGEIVVRITRADDEAGGWAVLSVEDHGIGVPSADLPHVFDRFYRARNAAGHIAGTGLGLAGVREIVERHGGAITARSAEGVGSTFTVRLPLGEAPTT